jgi:hypothetical protein
VDLVSISFLTADPEILYSLMDIEEDKAEDDDNVALSVCSCVLKVLLILIKPQQIDTENTSNSDDPKTSLVDLKDALDLASAYTFKNSEMNVETTDTPLETSFGDQKDLSDIKFASQISKQTWVQLQSSISLPVLALMIPHGFEIYLQRGTNIVYVYVYKVLLPDVNSRKLNVVTRCHQIIDSMTSDNPTKQLNSYKMILATYKVKETNNRGKKKNHLPLENTSADPLVDAIFCNGKYIVDNIDMDSVSEQLENVVGNNFEEPFVNFPGKEKLVESYGNRLAATVLHVNFCQWLMYQFNRLRDYPDYQRLFHYLNSRIGKIHNVHLPDHLVNKSTVINCARIMFRSLYQNIGTMIPEGQARIMAFILASNRMKTFEVFMNDSLKAELAGLPPNMGYQAKSIPCDYIIHPDEIKEGEDLVDLGFDKVHDTLQHLSYVATKQANSSAKISHSEFVLSYFENCFNKSNDRPELYFASELMKTWDMDCCKKIQDVVINKTFLKIGLTDDQIKITESKKAKRLASTFNILSEFDKTNRLQNFYKFLVSKEANLDFLSAIKKDIDSEIIKLKHKSGDDNKDKVSVLVERSLEQSYKEPYKMDLIQAMAIFCALVPYRRPEEAKSGMNNWAFQACSAVVKNNGLNLPDYNMETHTRGLRIHKEGYVQLLDEEYHDNDFKVRKTSAMKLGTYTKTRLLDMYLPSHCCSGFCWIFS